uniref:Putative secreted protein n=1 Tax=Ixodes ricinus TaxID=34613 RepID=A0A6B0ULU2_IXORI
MKTTRLQTAAPLAVATATHALPAVRVSKGHVASLYFESGFCSYTNHARFTRQMGRAPKFCDQNLRYQLRGGDERVGRLLASQPLRLLSSSPGENAAHAHLRPTFAGGHPPLKTLPMV